MVPVSVSSIIAVALLGAAPAPAPAHEPAGVAWEPSLLVQLQVSDLARSIQFYTKTLGFTLTELREDLQFAHLAVGVDGLQIGLSAGGSVPPDPGTITLNFGVRGDVEAARKLLEARALDFKGPTAVIPGKVRLAEFRDPDGYRIRLAGDDPPKSGAP